MERYNVATNFFVNIYFTKPMLQQYYQTNGSFANWYSIYIDKFQKIGLSVNLKILFFN